MNDCWEYNQPANTWTQRASLPVSKARYYATGFSVNGKVFIFGGTDGNNYQNDLWEFNPANNTWSQKASLPGSGRQQSDAFVLNGNAYIIGGFSAAGGTLKEVWKYNPVTNQWSQLANFPGATGPAGGVGFSINGLGYVVCGNGTAECWEFNPQVTGISDQGTTNQKITVFPNPASIFISLNIPAGITCKTVIIYNISGKIVLNETTLENSSATIDISSLQPGFYILKVKTISGTMLSSNFIKTEN
jgi:N-acetylneuraminic acid mutarotase